MKMHELHTKFLERYSISFLELTVEISRNKENTGFFFKSLMQYVLFSLCFFVYCTKKPVVKRQKQWCFQRKNSHNLYILRISVIMSVFFNSFTGNTSFCGLCKAILLYQLTEITLGKSHVFLQLLSSSGLKFSALSIEEKETKKLILPLVRACTLSNVLILNI